MATQVKRSALRSVDALKLVVDTRVNFREVDGYDVPSMIEEIKLAGKVVEPIHVREEDNVVLRGNRRVRAVQTMLADTNLNADLRKKIEKLEAFLYTGLDEKSTTELVLDHGSQKPLSRVEVIKACWRLSKLMYSEAEIIILLFQQLAKFTGNLRKAHEAAQLPAGEQREKFLKTWLHGTVGNFILPAARMGDLVREQYLLTETQKDRNLTDAEKARIQFNLDRKRVQDLVKAKKEDEEKDGWSADAGGAAFNEAIQRFIKEDKPSSGSGSGSGNKNRPSIEQVTQSADAMQSGMGLAMKMAVGKLSDADKGKIEQLDAEYHRRDKLFALLTAIEPKVVNAEVKALIVAILAGAPADVEKAAAPFLPTETTPSQS